MRPLHYIFLNKKITGDSSQNITYIKTKTEYTVTQEHVPIWEGTYWGRVKGLHWRCHILPFLNFGYCIEQVIEFLLGSYTFRLPAEKSQSCFYFIVYLRMITVMSFSDNSTTWIPYGSISIIYCYGLEWHCLIQSVGLVLIEW